MPDWIQANTLKFEEMQTYFNDLEMRQPELFNFTNNFMFTTNVNVFTSSFKNNEDYAELLAASDEDRQYETMNVVGKLFNDNNINTSDDGIQLETKDIIKINDFVEYWAEDLTTYIEDDEN